MNLINKLKRKLNSILKSDKKNIPSFNISSIHDDDIFIISYPKSGNTWVRFLIGNYISKERINFTNAHLIIPDIHFNPEQINKINTQVRFIKSHLEYKPYFKKTIYIVRDGRDVAVSNYFYSRRTGSINKDYSFHDFLVNYFIPGKLDFGDWGQHVQSWLTKKERTNLLIVKYEDILNNPQIALENMLAFCDLPIDIEKIEIAVGNSSFEEMLQDEIKHDKEINALVSYTDKSLRFVREGKSGNWEQIFSEKDLSVFMQKYGNLLKELEY
jgi:hypothetical protein